LATPVIEFFKSADGASADFIVDILVSSYLACILEKKLALRDPPRGAIARLDPVDPHTDIIGFLETLLVLETGFSGNFSQRLFR